MIHDRNCRQKNDGILPHRNDSHFRKTRFHRDIAVSTSSIPFSVRRTSTARRLRRAGVRPTIFRSSRACRVLPTVVGWPRTPRASSEVRTTRLLYKTIRTGIAYFRFKKLTICGLRRDETPLRGLTSRGGNREFPLTRPRQLASASRVHNAFPRDTRSGTILNYRWRRNREVRGQGSSMFGSIPCAKTISP